MSDRRGVLPVLADAEWTLVGPVVTWYAGNARDLPWRRPGAGAWAILVSEYMLQQTPVARVLPVYESWMARWPTPAALAAEAPGAAVRAWGRLGYPRRALRLHAAATDVVAVHGGSVPEDYDDLRKLPGVGDYTAAAVASFGFGRRHSVLDTNARRVLARAVAGREFPAPGSATIAERRLADAILPADPALAGRWAVASMELGALVCRSRAPRCGACPVVRVCAWRRAGKPAGDAVRRGQDYAGTDRQARGALVAALRESAGDLTAAELESAWPSALAQRSRALASLVADGLVQPLPGGMYRLPG
jgi:A/G-specific adenine glycosylase